MGLCEWRKQWTEWTDMDKKKVLVSYESNLAQNGKDLDVRNI